MFALLLDHSLVQANVAHINKHLQNTQTALMTTSLDILILHTIISTDHRTFYTREQKILQ